MAEVFLTDSACIYIVAVLKQITQRAGDAEYTDCISAEW